MARPLRLEYPGMVRHGVGFVQDAYQTGVYLLRRVINMDLKAVARTFGVSTARISRIQSDIEKDLKGRKMLLKLLKRYKVKN